MEFCPKCGGIIIIKDNKKAVCAKCGYRPKGKVKIQTSEKIEKAKGVAVIKARDLTTDPIIEIKCPNCKHEGAYFWTLQTRSSDESETKFYRCTKCDHTWRDYK